MRVNYIVLFSFFLHVKHQIVDQFRNKLVHFFFLNKIIFTARNTYNLYIFKNYFLPVFENKYIFSGEYSGHGDCKRRVITVCGSDIFKLYKCDQRNNLSNSFFSDPSVKNLDNLLNYFKADYILIPTDYNQLIKVYNNLRLKEIARNKNYVLFKIK